ncbi:hypothetical protein PAXRUDRAFT_287597, partial [Paxillus rubicundulus Ve08.2h10]
PTPRRQGTLPRRLIHGVTGPPVLCVDPLCWCQLSAASCSRRGCVPVYYYSTHYILYYLPSNSHIYTVESCR